MRWTVPRFYFNLCSGTEFVEDGEGVDLSDIASARRQAVNSLRDVMAGDLIAGTLNTASFIEIEDSEHNVIEAVSFEQAVLVRHEVCASRRHK